MNSGTAAVSSLRIAIGTSLVALVASAAPAAQMAAGTCLLVRVPDRIVLPDDSTAPGGELRICLHRALTPVRSLNELSLGGVKLGLVTSRPRTMELPAVADTPVVYFSRGDNGDLRLLGYAWPHRGRMIFHAIEVGTASARGRTLADPVAAPRRHDDALVLLAARTN